LVIVKVKLVELFTGIDVAPNAFEIDGAPTTVKLADAVLPVPVAVDVTACDVLSLTPAVVPVTSTVSVHDPFAPTVAPDRLIAPVPAVAVADPPHPFVRPFGVATTNPGGRLSVKATPGNGAEFEFEIVNVKPVEPFSGIVGAPNALLIEGATPTVKLSDPGWPRAVPDSVALGAVV
jgi:hypothetical protein